MTTVSMRKLSDKTLAFYEWLEHDGNLTPRQLKLLRNHRALTGFVELLVNNHRNLKADISSTEVESPELDGDKS